MTCPPLLTHCLPFSCPHPSVSTSQITDTFHVVLHWVPHQLGDLWGQRHSGLGSCGMLWTTSLPPAPSSSLLAFSLPPPPTVIGTFRQPKALVLFVWAAICQAVI